MHLCEAKANILQRRRLDCMLHSMRFLDDDDDGRKIFQRFHPCQLQFSHAHRCSDCTVLFHLPPAPCLRQEAMPLGPHGKSQHLHLCGMHGIPQWDSGRVQVLKKRWQSPGPTMTIPSSSCSSRKHHAHWCSVCGFGATPASSDTGHSAHVLKISSTQKICRRAKGCHEPCVAVPHNFH